jgi:hypothetical protein
MVHTSSVLAAVEFRGGTLEHGCVAARRASRLVGVLVIPFWENVVMTFSFETHALPLMLSMQSNEDLELVAETKRLGLATRRSESRTIIDYLREAGYIRTVWEGDGTCTGVVTVRGLQQLDLWPSDEERSLYLAKRIVVALERMADLEDASESPNADRSTKLRSFARLVADKGTDFAVQLGAAVLAK